VHGVDDQISAAQQEDRNSNEQKNRHVASPQSFALAYQRATMIAVPKSMSVAPHRFTVPLPFSQ